MKKIFIIVALLASYVANSQPGYTTINSRFNWLAGIFRALGLPSGDSAQFTPGQSFRQGSVYFDSVNTPDSPNGYYIWEDPTGGNAPFWNLQGNDQICQNRLITDWNVSWQGVGFNYSVHGGLSDGTGEYQIGCSFYSGDSATVTFTTADPDEDRIDIIYLDATGVHVREGELAAPGTAVRPTVDADEILLTEVLVAAGATTPTLTQLIVYNENTESVVTNTGTTTNGANNTNVYIGTLSTNVTNINHNDQVFFTKAPPASTWGVLGFDGISLAIRLKATMPTNANLGVALQVGATTSGVEVIVPLVKTNSTSYQQISIPLSAFGNMANTSITRVRFRYIRPASGATYTGFYLDYIYFVDGFSSGPGAAATFTFNPPVGFQVTPANTQQSPGTWTMGYATGTLPGQYYTREGFITLPDFVNAMGALDGRTKTAEGATIDGNELFLQTVDTDDDGLMTSAMFNKLDSNYYIANAGDGDTLAFPDPVSANITRIKSVKGIGGIVITTTDTTVIWDGTGVGGGSSLFPVTGTGTATGNVTGTVGTNQLVISVAEGGSFGVQNSGGGGDWSGEINVEDQNVEIITTSLTGNADIQVGGARINFNSAAGTYEFENLADDGAATKVVVYNTTTDAIGTVDLAGLGGGGSGTVNTGAANTLAYYPSGGTTVDDFPLGTGNQILGMNSGATENEYKTFSVGTTGTDFAIAHTANTVTFNIPDASASNRGLITTGGQTIAGAKTFSSFATFSGAFSTNGTAGNSNLYVSGGITANRNTTATLLPLGAAGIGARLFVNGTTSYTMTASDAWSTVDVGTTGGVTEAASGTHPIIASMVLRPVTVTNGAGATDILAGLYIEGPATGVTPATASYGLWLDAGNARLDGNVSIGGGTVAASATASLNFINGTVPSASITDGVVLYAEDVAASSELKVRDDAGNITVLGPHNFTGIPNGRSEELAWSFYSERDGQFINVDMLKLARLLEKLTGEKLVYIGSIDNKPNTQNK